MADSSKSSKKTDQQVASDFTSYYLQRVTQEFAEDLDKVRTADDFKNDALPLLVNALQQGTALFSPEDQRRIVTAEAAAAKNDSV
ncbi:ribosome-assembly protein 3-domain-containing protein [Bombardia bombarda]|uniref:Ribosome assembly protein 3 n=1 Tax=Bombardia bombarda TaxID=252184 RepID=A0AA39U2L1_9PEZI|nr:ribosome-assembly protein 3-domain-containing protein [Bombardia bombarda]